MFPKKKDAQFLLTACREKTGLRTIGAGNPLPAKACHQRNPARIADGTRFAYRACT
jgi:hypothetical protein